MKPTSPIAVSAGAGGITGALVMILAWAASEFGVTMPPEIVTALMVIFQPILHIVGTKYFPSIETMAEERKS
jgi:hypothetical protein